MVWHQANNGNKHIGGLRDAHFNQVDNWASHIMFMQLDRVLPSIHNLQMFPDYVKILAWSGT